MRHPPSFARCSLPLLLLWACSGGEIHGDGSRGPDERDVGAAAADVAPDDAATRSDIAAQSRDSGPVDAADVTDGPSGCPCEHGPCVRLEKGPAEPACHPACNNGSCPAGQVCLQFPDGGRCLPAGERVDGVFCISPSECEGGLCIWSGGAPALCSSECSGPEDNRCGAERSCLPSRVPRGSFHCYPTGVIPLGESCFQDEHGCAEGYCIGAGRSQYCTRLCTAASPNNCPEGWGCVNMSPAEEGSMCCDPAQSPPGSCF